MRYTYVLLATLISVLLMAPAASAGNITLKPGAVSLKGIPGHTATHNFRVFNLTDSVYEFTADVSDVVVQDGQRVFVPADQSALSLASLVKLSSSAFELKPGEEQSVDVTFVLPTHTAMRAVAVFFHGKPVQSASPLKIQLNLGAVVDFSISDDVDLQLSAPDITPQSDSANAVITEQLSNLGPEPANVKGVAAILDSAGGLVGKAVFDQKRVLPGEHNVIRAEYPGVLPSGNYRVLCSVEYVGRTVTKMAEFRIP